MRNILIAIIQPMVYVGLWVLIVIMYIWSGGNMGFINAFFDRKIRRGDWRKKVLEGKLEYERKQTDSN